MNNIKPCDFMPNFQLAIRERNTQNYFKLPQLQYDTVSFSGISDEYSLKDYDEVLIYDKTFNKNYESPQFRDKRADFDKWIDKLKNHQVPKNICHDCSKQDAEAFGLYEIAPNGKSNPPRIYYKIVDRTLVVLSCGNKKTQDADIAKAKKIAKDEALLRAFVSEKLSARADDDKKQQAVTDRRTTLEQVKQKQQAAILAGFESVITESKEDIENSQLSSLKSYREQLSLAEAEYPEHKGVQDAIKSVDITIGQLQQALDDLKVEEDDTSESVDTKVLQTMLFADDCQKACFNDIVAPLLQEIDTLRLNNLSNIIEIREIYIAIKKQFKSMQADVKKQEYNKNSNVVLYLKEYNTQVKRKADEVVGDKDKLDTLSLSESSDKLAKLKVLQAAGESLYEKYQESLSNRYFSRRTEKAETNTPTATKVEDEPAKLEPPIPQSVEDEKPDNYSILSQTIEALGIEKEIPNITSEDKKAFQKAMQSVLETIDLSTVNGDNFNNIIEAIFNNTEVKAILDKYKTDSETLETPKTPELPKTVEPKSRQEDKIEDLIAEYQNSVFLHKAVDKVMDKLFSQCHAVDVDTLRTKYLSLFKREELEQADIKKETKILVEKAKVLKQKLKDEEIQNEILRRKEYEAGILRAQKVQDILFEVMSEPKKSAQDSAEFLEKVLNEQESEKLSELDEMLVELD